MRMTRLGPQSIGRRSGPAGAGAATDCGEGQGGRRGEAVPDRGFAPRSMPLTSFDLSRRASMGGRAVAAIFHLEFSLGATAPAARGPGTGRGQIGA
eukprot:4396027-Pyramimonas_sp.AAC.1